MTDRKKPGVAFWATVVVVGLLLYVASIGPILWAAKNLQAEWPIKLLQIYAWPAQWVYDHGPGPISDALHWYAGLWVD